MRGAVRAALSPAVAGAVLLAALAGGAHAAELELSYGRAALTGGRPGWSALELEVTSRRPDRTALGLALRELDRFGTRDLEVAASAAAPLGARITMEAEASASPQHRFTPAWMGALRLNCALGGGVVASSGARWSRYGGSPLTSSARVGTIGLERYWGSQRLSWTGYLADVAGGVSGSQRVAWDLYYGERSRVGLAVAGGDEVESAAAPALRMARVMGASLGGRHELTERWGISYEVGVARQGALYTRTGARLGVLHAF